MAATGTGISRVGQIAINAHDVERATAFYQDALGLKLLFKAPPGLAFFDCGGVRLMLSRPEKPEFDHPGSILYFAVPDIQAAYAVMKGKGVHFEDEPHLLAKMGRTCVQKPTGAWFTQASGPVYVEPETT